MIFFVNTLTMECPVFEGQIKFEHGIDQALTYPEYTLPPEYAVVMQAPLPAYDSSTQIVEAVQPPILTDGVWVQGWAVRALTEAEVARRVAFKAEMDAQTAQANLAANGAQMATGVPEATVIYI